MASPRVPELRAMPSPHRELHRAVGEQDHVLHRQRLRAVHLSLLRLRAPPLPAAGGGQRTPFSFSSSVSRGTHDVDDSQVTALFCERHSQV